MTCKIIKTIKSLAYANGLRKSKPTPKTRPYPEGYFMGEEYNMSPLKRLLSDICEFSNKNDNQDTSYFKNFAKNCLKFILGK